MFDNNSLHFLYICTLEILVDNNTKLYCNFLKIVNKEAALGLCDLIDQQLERRTEIAKL
jgi:hypothetical protein